MAKYRYERSYPFAAFITNLGKYNEGCLVGEWVSFPLHQNIEDIFLRIGLLQKGYEEYFISDYDIYVEQLEAAMLGEFASIETLHELALRIDALDSYDYEVFNAVLEFHQPRCLSELFDLMDRLPEHLLLKDIKNHYELGYYLVEETDLYDAGVLQQYIDYERLGRDVSLQEGGFFTSRGYLVSES